MTKEPKQGPCECVADLTDLEQAVMIDKHADAIAEFVCGLMKEDGTNRPCIGLLSIYTTIGRVVSGMTNTEDEEGMMLDHMMGVICDIIEISKITEESTEQNAPTSNCVH